MSFINCGEPVFMLTGGIKGGGEVYAERIINSNCEDIFFFSFLFFIIFFHFLKFVSYENEMILTFAPYSKNANKTVLVWYCFPRQWSLGSQVKGFTPFSSLSSEYFIYFRSNRSDWSLIQTN